MHRKGIEAMTGTRRALVFCALTLAMASLIAAPARAIEIELPAERTMDLNGFWELRLQFLGDDMPLSGHGVSLSQFRHVLNLETEIELFPDGVGMFDFMMMYSRFIVTYECAYQRGEGSGCIVPGFKNMDPLFNSAAHYGGREKDVNRLPSNLRRAKDGELWAGGVMQSRFKFGTIREARQKLTQHEGVLRADSRTNTSFRETIGRSRRFRDAINPPAIMNNPDPFAFLFNSAARTKLDPPIGSEFTPNFGKVRAGAYNERVHLQYLQAARAPLGDDFQTLFGEKFLVGGFLNVKNDDEAVLGNAELRARNTAIARSGLAEGTPFYQEVSDGQGVVVDTQAIVNERDLLLFPKLECLPENPDCDPGLLTPEEKDELEALNEDVANRATLDNAQLDYFTIDSSYYGAYQLPSALPDPPDDEKLVNPNLIATRPDGTPEEPSGTIGVLAKRTGNSELLDAQWGSHQLSFNRVVPYLATLDTEIEPYGYFNSGSAVDSVEAFAIGLTRDMGAGRHRVRLSAAHRPPDWVHPAVPPAGERRHRPGGAAPKPGAGLLRARRCAQLEGRPAERAGDRLAARGARLGRGGSAGDRALRRVGQRHRDPGRGGGGNRNPHRAAVYARPADSRRQ